MKKYLKTTDEIVNALQSGKVIKSHTEAGHDYEYTLSHGKFVIGKDTKDGSVYFNDSIASYENPYIEEDPKPELKLKVGKFYKTRGNVIVLCCFEGYSGKFMVVRQSDGHDYYVTANGRNANRELDIIAPWEEEHAEND